MTVDDYKLASFPPEFFHQADIDILTLPQRQTAFRYVLLPQWGSKDMLINAQQKIMPAASSYELGDKVLVFLEGIFHGHFAQCQVLTSFLRDVAEGDSNRERRHHAVVEAISCGKGRHKRISRNIRPIAHDEAVILGVRAV